MSHTDELADELDKLEEMSDTEGQEIKHMALQMLDAMGEI